LVEGFFALEAAVGKEAADDGAGAADAGAAVDVHAAAGLHGVVHTVEDLQHVNALRGDAVVADGLAEVLDAEREFAVVGFELAVFGEVDEALDAGFDQALQTLARGLAVGAAGVLAG
jgi:hypothetical protein